jgi:hypothetical protein
MPRRSSSMSARPALAAFRAHCDTAAKPAGCPGPPPRRLSRGGRCDVACPSSVASSRASSWHERRVRRGRHGRRRSRAFLRKVMMPGRAECRARARHRSGGWRAASARALLPWHDVGDRRADWRAAPPQGRRRRSKQMRPRRRSNDPPTRSARRQEQLSREPRIRSRDQNLQPRVLHERETPRRPPSPTMAHGSRRRRAKRIHPAWAAFRRDAEPVS